MQRLLDVVEALVERRGHRGQLVRGGAQRFPVVGHEALDVADDVVEVATARRRPRSGSLASSPVTAARFWLSWRIRSVLSLQRRHQDRQVLQRGEDVVAVVAERRNRLRQFDEGVTDVGALAAQVVGGGVDRTRPAC